MIAEGEPGFDAILFGLQPLLAEAGDLSGGERLIGELHERVAVPFVERVVEQAQGAGRVADSQRSSSVGGAPFEAKRVDEISFETQGIARGFADEHAGGRTPSAFGLQAAAQVGDVRLDRCRRRVRRGLAPQLVDQPIEGDDLVQVHQQDAQHGALARRTELDSCPVVVNDCQWPEDPDAHRGSGLLHPACGFHSPVKVLGRATPNREEAARHRLRPCWRGTRPARSDGTRR